MYYQHAAQMKVWWPATIELPQDNGKTARIPILVLYALPDRQELTSLRDAASNGDSTLTDSFLESHILGWDDAVRDDGGVPLLFSPHALQALLLNPYVYRAMLGGFMAAISGAPAGNS